MNTYNPLTASGRYEIKNYIYENKKNIIVILTVLIFIVIVLLLVQSTSPKPAFTTPKTIGPVSKTNSYYGYGQYTPPRSLYNF